jgi:hypothetical protein
MFKIEQRASQFVGLRGNYAGDGKFLSQIFQRKRPYLPNLP